MFLGCAATRPALPLAFRAATAVLALLQFALMAGASYGGARCRQGLTSRGFAMRFKGVASVRRAADAAAPRGAAYTTRATVRADAVNVTHLAGLAVDAVVVASNASAEVARALAVQPALSLSVRVPHSGGSYAGARCAAR